NLLPPYPLPVRHRIPRAQPRTAATPEQLRGDAVTPLSDIYSLGAVLYELLTATCPRQFRLLTPMAIDAVLRTPIAPPSAGAADKRVARLLKGDLDNILMRALDADPLRRYESAAQLADDLRRYLGQQPVQARPPTIRYRALKFASRHRVPVAATAAVFVALSIALATSLYEARIAGSGLRQIRTVADAPRLR